jgi:hypothetical protein
MPISISTATRKSRRVSAWILFTLVVVMVATLPRVHAVADQNAAEKAVSQGKILNKPEKLETFRDQAFGMFIHWSRRAPSRLRNKSYPTRNCPAPEAEHSH